MIDLKKLFVRHTNRTAHHAIDSGFYPPRPSAHGLEVEYQGLIATQFRRWGISPECAAVEVRQLGTAPDGFEVFMGMVRLIRWDRESALRVLIGWPLLEVKVRKSVSATWLADFSHFGGLWLNASENLETAGELHAMLVQHVPFPKTSAARGVREPSPSYSTCPGAQASSAYMQTEHGISQSAD